MLVVVVSGSYPRRFISSCRALIDADRDEVPSRSILVDFFDIFLAPQKSKCSTDDISLRSIDRSLDSFQVRLFLRSSLLGALIALSVFILR